MTERSTLVVVGNAFHHFDRDAAMAEIRRILRPGGALALFWAWPAEEEQLKIPGMRAIYEAVDGTHAEAAIMAAHRSWAESPATVDGFDPFERREFAATHVLPAARLADLYATFSDVLSLPDPTRAWLLDRIRQLSRELPETLHLPQRTVVDLCVRTRERQRRETGEARRERVRGIEPPFRAWEARVLPLNHTRVGPPPEAARRQCRPAPEGRAKRSC